MHVERWCGGVHVERRYGGIEVWKCVTVEYGGVQASNLDITHEYFYHHIVYIGKQKISQSLLQLLPEGRIYNITVEER